MFRRGAHGSRRRAPPSRVSAFKGVQSQSEEHVSEDIALPLGSQPFAHATRTEGAGEAQFGTSESPQSHTSNNRSLSNESKGAVVLSTSSCSVKVIGNSKSSLSSSSSRHNSPEVPPDPMESQPNTKQLLAPPSVTEYCSSSIEALESSSDSDEDTIKSEDEALKKQHNETPFGFEQAAVHPVQENPSSVKGFERLTVTHTQNMLPLDDFPTRRHSFDPSTFGSTSGVKQQAPKRARTRQELRRRRSEGSHMFAREKPELHDTRGTPGFLRDSPRRARENLLNEREKVFQEMREPPRSTSPVSRLYWRKRICCEVLQAKGEIDNKSYDDVIQQIRSDKTLDKNSATKWLVLNDIPPMEWAQVDKLLLRMGFYDERDPEAEDKDSYFEKLAKVHFLRSIFSTYGETEFPQEGYDNRCVVSVGALVNAVCENAPQILRLRRLSQSPKLSKRRPQVADVDTLYRQKRRHVRKPIGYRTRSVFQKLFDERSAFGAKRFEARHRREQELKKITPFKPYLPHRPPHYCTESSVPVVERLLQAGVQQEEKLKQKRCELAKLRRELEEQEYDKVLEYRAEKSSKIKDDPEMSKRFNFMSSRFIRRYQASHPSGLRETDFEELPPYAWSIKSMFGPLFSARARYERAHWMRCVENQLSPIGLKKIGVDFDTLSGERRDELAELGRRVVEQLNKPVLDAVVEIPYFGTIKLHCHVVEFVKKAVDNTKQRNISKIHKKILTRFDCTLKALPSTSTGTSSQESAYEKNFELKPQSALKS